jgi:hypothetical protein
MKNIFVLIILYSTICLARTDMEIAKEMQVVTKRVLELNEEIVVESNIVQGIVDNLKNKTPSEEEVDKHIKKFNALMGERLHLQDKATALIKEHNAKPGSKQLSIDSKKDKEDSI